MKTNELNKNITPEEHLFENLQTYTPEDVGWRPEKKPPMVGYVKQVSA